MEELIVPTVQESIDNGITLFKKYISKVRAALDAINEFKTELLLTTKLPIEVKYTTWSGDSKFEDPKTDKRININIFSPDKKLVVAIDSLFLVHTAEEMHCGRIRIRLSDDVAELKKKLKYY